MTEAESEAEPEAESEPEALRGVPAPAHITLFGFDPARATARVETRGVAWRARRSSLALVGGVIVAPLAALVPPHAPWALAALGVSLVTARHYWTERHSLHALEGDCPRCGEGVSISRVVRLRHPHPISCTSCRYELAIRVDL